MRNFTQTDGKILEVGVRIVIAVIVLIYSQSQDQKIAKEVENQINKIRKLFVINKGEETQQETHFDINPTGEQT